MISIHTVYGQDAGQRNYTIENKLLLEAIKKYKTSLELAIEEATLKIEANNMWINLINDKKEIRKLKKNNENQMKIIESNKRRISNIHFQNKSAHSEPTQLTNKEARAIKLLGNISLNNGVESEKIISIYQQKITQATKNSLKNNEEQWLEIVKKWNEIIEIINKIMKISFTAGEYFFVVAEMIKPGIIVGNDQDGRKEIENLKTKILIELNKDESF